MIRAHFGLQKNPFDRRVTHAAAHQQEVFDILKVHAQQGGLCLVLGEPGTGKSVMKQALLDHDPKRMITPVVNRTLHTYHNTLRILVRSLSDRVQGRDHRCERLLVQEAFQVHRTGKMLVPVIDDAHLMHSESSAQTAPALRRLPAAPTTWSSSASRPCFNRLALSINEEIRSRVTYSVVLPRLAPEAIEAFILARAGPLPAWATTPSPRKRSR